MKKSTYLIGLALGASTLTFAQVGIGTSTPSSPLDIQADDAAIDLNSEAADGSRDPKINFQLTGTTTFSIGLDDADSDKLKIGVGAPETSTRMTIDGSGNVGIGNTSPTATLDVDGSAIFNESGAAVDFRVEGDTEANLLFVDASADRIGIGTSSPSAKLNVTRSAADWNPSIVINNQNASDGSIATINMVTEDESTGLSIGKHSSGHGTPDLAYINQQLNADLHFLTNNTERMRIDASGNVGIGTTSPSTLLDVEGRVSIAPNGVTNDNAYNGNLVITKAAASGQYINLIRSANQAWSIGTVYNTSTFGIGSGQTTDASFDPDLTISNTTGYVGIGRTAATYPLEVEGDASKTSSGDWQANSDARLKKDMQQMDSKEILNKMLQLKGITYYWNDTVTGNKRPTRLQYGFTAQNIQEVFPLLVQEDSLGYLSTGYGTYDAMYVESMRALQQQIDDQQAIIEAQKKENESQKAELKTQKAEIESLKAEASNATSSSEENASEIEVLKAQVQQLLQLIQQQESVSIVK